MCPGNSAPETEPGFGWHPKLANLVFISGLSGPGMTACVDTTHLFPFVGTPCGALAAITGPVNFIKGGSLSWALSLCVQRGFIEHGTST